MKISIASETKSASADVSIKKYKDALNTFVKKVNEKSPTGLKTKDITDYIATVKKGIESGELKLDKLFKSISDIESIQQGIEQEAKKRANKIEEALNFYNGLKTMAEDSEKKDAKQAFLRLKMRMPEFKVDGKSVKF